MGGKVKKIGILAKTTLCCSLPVCKEFAFLCACWAAHRGGFEVFFYHLGEDEGGDEGGEDVGYGFC